MSVASTLTAPIQNQASINADSSFFLTASTLAAPAPPPLAIVEGSAVVNSVTFGLQGGGLLTGSGLDVRGVSSFTLGNISTLTVSTGPGQDPGGFGVGGIAFLALPQQSSLRASVIQPNATTTGVDVVTNVLTAQNVSTANMTLVTLNGSQYVEGAEEQWGRVLLLNAGGNFSTIVLDKPYANDRFSVVAKASAAVDLVYRPLWVSTTSVSSFVVFNGGIPGNFFASWITSGLPTQ